MLVNMINIDENEMTNTWAFIEFVGLGDVTFTEADALANFWPWFRLWIRLR